MLYLFQFSSLSLQIWQSLLWKLDLISCFIFSDWSFILLNGNFVQILFWTVVCFVSHHILLFPQIEIGFKIIIYNSLLKYIRYIDIYWKYWDVLIYIAVYWYIFLSIKLVWVHHCWHWSYNSTNSYFVCFLLSVGVCVVHPLFICLGLYYHLNSFVTCIVLSGYESKL